MKRAISSRLDSTIDRRDLPIERIAHRVELGEPGHGVRRVEQRPVPASSRALAQHFRLRVQIDHRAVLLQALTVRGPDHDAAAGREHHIGEGSQLGQHGLLAVAEARFALDLEDRRNRHAELALELRIRVDERLAESPRELPSERRLAGARQSDQVKIAPMQMHPRIVEDSPWPDDRAATAPETAARRGHVRVRAARRIVAASHERVDHLIALIDSLITRGVRKMSSSCFSLVRLVVLNR